MALREGLVLSPPPPPPGGPAILRAEALDEAPRELCDAPTAHLDPGAPTGLGLAGGLARLSAGMDSPSAACPGGGMKASYTGLRSHSLEASTSAEGLGSRPWLEAAAAVEGGRGGGGGGRLGGSTGFSEEEEEEEAAAEEVKSGVGLEREECCALPTLFSKSPPSPISPPPTPKAFSRAT